MRSFGISAMRMMAASYLFCGLSTMISTYFQATEKVGFSMVIQLCRQMLFLVPALWCLDRLFHLNGIWLAFPVAETATLLVALVMMAWHRRKISHPVLSWIWWLYFCHSSVIPWYVLQWSKANFFTFFPTSLLASFFNSTRKKLVTLDFSVKKKSIWNWIHTLYDYWNFISFLILQTWIYIIISLTFPIL